MARRSAAVVLGIGLVAGAVATPSSQQQEPRFRGGTNQVRLDVYVSANGAAVTDLTRDDFEVFEDNAPQTVSAFELIRARERVAASARVEPNTVAESRARAAQPDTRLFVLFLDTLHVHVEGSYRAQGPTATLLDRVVGEDDLVGVMTPEISARNITFSPRTDSVSRLLRDNWTWGERQSAMARDPRDRDIEQCYPDTGPTEGLARPLLQRRQEGRVMKAIEDLIQHLEGLREERSFVLLLTEGWLMPRADASLARPINWPGGRRTVPGGPDNLGLTPEGKLTVREQSGDRSFESCERERSMLANEDFEMEFRLLMRRANRANVSFYPIDPRGLVAFDTDLGPDRPLGPIADAASMRSRQNNLRQLAEETDGEVILNTNIDKAMPKLLADVGSYYLLGYVSTNQKLDGKYRRLTVKVKRPGVTVRARPGYLAPSAQDVGAAPSTTMAARPQAPPGVDQALSRLPTGRVPTPMYVAAVGGAGFVQVTFEVDRATASSVGWEKGADIRVEIGRADNNTPRAVETVRLDPGTRVYSLRYPERELLAPGRYQIRVLATPDGARVPLNVATDATVPGDDALLGTAAVVSRRGPFTGRLPQPTADPRFRRTERLVVETPIIAKDTTIDARLLNKVGQPMEIPVTLSEKIDDSLQLRTSVAEIALAPLAPGEYVVEITGTKDGKTERISYALRIIP